MSRPIASRIVTPLQKMHRSKRTAEFKEKENRKKREKQAATDAKIHAMLYEHPMQVAAHLADHDDQVRWAAEKLIVMMGGAGAQALVSSLDNFKTWERERAVEMLGDMGAAAWPHAGAIAAWLDRTAGEIDLVREAAADALGKMGPAGAAHAPALFARLEDEDEIEDVVEAATEALRLLGYM
jgi:HEAT repeat protein